VVHLDSDRLDHRKFELQSTPRDGVHESHRRCCGFLRNEDVAIQIWVCIYVHVTSSSLSYIMIKTRSHQVLNTLSPPKRQPLYSRHCVTELFYILFTSVIILGKDWCNLLKVKAPSTKQLKQVTWTDSRTTLLIRTVQQIFVYIAVSAANYKFCVVVENHQQYFCHGNPRQRSFCHCFSRSAG
jgi:hypothetical protein